MRLMNKIIWKQYDSRWGSHPYPTRNCTMSGAGCGCVACTHIAMEQGRYADWTPEPLREWMVEQGFAIVNKGTSYSGMTKTLRHIGHDRVVVVDENDPMDKAWAELKKGNRIGVLLFRGGKAPDKTEWTKKGHYVAFTSFRVKDGKYEFYCKDSGGRGHDGWYSYQSSMAGRVYMVWIVERIKIKATTYKPKTAYKGTLPKGVVKNGSKGDDVKALQTFLNWAIGAKLVVDGDAGAKTDVAIMTYQKTYKLVVDGVFGSKSKQKGQTIINAHKVKQTKWDKAVEWARKVANDNRYGYVRFTDAEYTHECCICHPRNHDLGWNCIGFAYAIWRHGAGLPTRCSCEVINDQTYNRLLKMDGDEAIALIRQKLGCNDVTALRNAGKAIPLERLQPGDIIVFYDGNSYYHTGFYQGNGKYADCTSTRSDSIKTDMTLSAAQKADIKLVIRYTGK